MNKFVAIVGAIALLAGGYYLGNANTPEPTIIKVPEAPKAAFSSSGSDEVKAVVAAKVPLSRLGQAEEVAAMVTFLASERASLVTGACLNVDGGQSRSLI